MSVIVFLLLCAMTFCIPFERVAAVLVGEGGQTVVRFIGYAALASSLLCIAGRVTIRRVPLAAAAVALLLMWSMLSLAWTVDYAVTFAQVQTYVALSLFFWMIWEFCPTLERQLWLMRSYVIGCCVPLVLMGISYITLGAGKDSFIRYTGGRMNQNDLSLILVVAILMAAYLASRPSLKSKYLYRLYWTFIPVAGVAVFLTGSRTGAFLIIVAVVLFLASPQRGGLRGKTIFLCATICGAILVATFVPSGLLTRVGEGIRAPTEMSSFGTRLDYWQRGLKCFAETPVLGVGAGGFRTAISADYQAGAVSHNTLIGMLVEGGVVGLGLYLTILALVVRAVWSMPRNEKFFWFSVLLVIGTSSLANDVEAKKGTWLVFGLIFAQADALRNRNLSAFAPRWPRQQGGMMPSRS